MADQVLADIRSRGLVSGDRYLTAEEARSNFRVGKGLINDALKLLAERQVLVRKRRAGTFIGPQFSVEADLAAREPVLKIVHVLMPMDYYRSNVIPGSTFVDQLSQAIPGVSVQIHHIADASTTQYTLELIDRLRLSKGGNKGQSEGLVLLRSSREAQLAAEKSGLPAVAFGSTYPDVLKLCSIDPDQAQTGRLAAEAALERGHQRFALIMRNHWRRGDNLLMDGFSQVLGEAGVGVDRVRVLSTPEDAAVIEHDVAALLEQDPHPTALVCRSRFHAEAAIRGIRERGLVPGKDVLVISAQSGAMTDSSASLSIVPVLNGPEMVAKVGTLLSEIAQGVDRRGVRKRIAVKVIASPVEGEQATEQGRKAG